MHKLTDLSGGGVMVNYQCNAACRHCLYACSPTRSGRYMSRKTAEAVAELLREGRCRSVHIGGGEPFLDFDKLLDVLSVLQSVGISIDYVETNAFWAADNNEVKKRLYALQKAGADTLCISLDPFHAEYVPPAKPLFLAECCQEAGFGYFLWQERFLPMLNFDTRESRASMEKLISPDYVLKTARMYGLSMGGRAVNIENEYVEKKPSASLADGTPCYRLLDAGHFHVDVFNRYIPGCTGLAVSFAEIIDGIPEGKYPVMETLYQGGLNGLLEYAVAKGFKPKAGRAASLRGSPCVPDGHASDGFTSGGYTSKCAMCFHIRRWLCKNAPSPELDAELYEESLRYY